MILQKGQKFAGLVPPKSEKVSRRLFYHFLWKNRKSLQKKC